MFTKEHFEKFNKNIVLKYYKTTDSIKNYFYRELLIDSFNLCHILNVIFEQELKIVTTQDNDFYMNCNVAVLLSVHSPALLPSFVG